LNNVHIKKYNLGKMWCSFFCP